MNCVATRLLMQLAERWVGWAPTVCNRQGLHIRSFDQIGDTEGADRHCLHVLPVQAPGGQS